MADMVGEQDIRGLDIDKLVKGFADEELIMKKFVTVSPTSASQIRWYQKTAGFLDTTDTTGMTGSRIKSSPGALPEVIGPTWTRNTSYVHKFFISSETITVEDIKECDVDVLATTIRDIVRGLGRQVDAHIIDVLTESFTAATIQSISVTDEWDDTTSAIVISDLLKGKEYIQNYNYSTEGLVLLCRPDCARFLLNHLIAVKGSSIPDFSSDLARSGVIASVLGIRIVVSTLVTSDYAVLFVPQRAVTYKQFMPISSTVIDDPMIGKKVRVSEEGVALLTDPKAVVLYDNVGPS